MVFIISIHINTKYRGVTAKAWRHGLENDGGIVAVGRRADDR